MRACWCMHDRRRLLQLHVIRKMAAVLFVFLLCLAGWHSLVNAAAPKKEFNVQVFPDGSFTIGFMKNWIESECWLKSGPIMIRANNKVYSSEDGSLSIKPKSFMEFANINMGPIRRYSWTWVTSDDSLEVTTGIELYYHYLYNPYPHWYPNVGPYRRIVFNLDFNRQLNNTNGDKDDIQASFPSFILADSDDQRGWMTYTGGMASGVEFGVLNHLSKIPGGLEGGVPLVLFDKDTRDTLVLSPSSQFMDSSQATWTTASGERIVGFGPMGSLTKFQQYGGYFSTVLLVGNGIVDSILEWGQSMGVYDLRSDDFSINYLGYWTDNGACYYYYSEPYANYQEAMLAVKEYAEQENIPFRYLQLDSWWYFKGEQGGVKNWTAMPSAFPHGIEELSVKTGWPIVAHNRYWSGDTDYAKQNGGEFDFVIEGDIALPNDTNFWPHLLSTAKKNWGLITYEQDWLDYTGAHLPATYEVYQFAEEWLGAMSSAAEDNDLFIQYCMAWPRHFLAATSNGRVTQIRVSGDYHPGNTQWRIGDTTILAEALGLSAFKDNFHTVSKENECKFSDPEPYPELETVSAALSGGPVGIGDAVGSMNKQLIMSTCMVDGRLLKPSRPAMSLDSTIIQRTFGSGGPVGELSAAYTVFGEVVYHMLLGADLKSPYSMSLKELPMPSNVTSRPSSTIAYRADWSGKVTSVKSVTSSLPVPSCGREDYQYWVLAPVVQEDLVFLGEPSKVVSVSRTRFISLVYHNNASSANGGVSGASVEMRGVPSEVVTTAAVINKDMDHIKYFTCKIPSVGTATLQLPSGECS